MGNCIGATPADGDDYTWALRHPGAGADEAVLGVPAGATVVVVQAAPGGAVDLRVKPDPLAPQMLELERRLAELENGLRLVRDRNTHLERLFHLYINADENGVASGEDLAASVSMETHGATG